MRRLPECLALVILSLTTTAATYAAVPASITIQGKLTDAAGVPLPAGAKSFNFKIFGSEAGGSPVWPSIFGEPQVLSSDASGLWIALMGAISPLTEPVFADSVRWLEVTVDGVTLPRVRLATGPYAHRVATVEGASGGTITSKVSIGPGHSNTGADAFVAGMNNVVSGDFSAVSGGSFNEASGLNSSVAGGLANYATDSFAVVGGGYANTATSPHGVIGGGQSNKVDANFGTIGGGDSNEVGVSTQVGNYATIGGGLSNDAVSNFATIGGGENNHAAGEGATVGGGINNHVTGGGTIAGGTDNYASGGGFVGGGSENTISAPSATIAGGLRNSADWFAATISGGLDNRASGWASAIPGGSQNTTGGWNSFAGGIMAHAAHHFSFVWNSDSLDTAYSTREKQFSVNAPNGVSIMSPANSKTIYLGDLYKDNLIIAWGSVNADGSILAHFGVSSISHTVTGEYRINLDVTTTGNTANNLAASALLEVDNIPTSDATARLIYANMISGDGNSFDIFITNGSHVAVDNQFMFIVTAR